ncbi:hypothetical protein MCSF7_02699 [Mycoplasmopsis columbina SF7]|uniref:Uncharacterized protein n=1 Tax=Mycoplasmopsis columbina SF7 TaxID=1037410 RepID=F9UJ82_9BACT|nr:hypothetical protein [Mycoplasmopsis columbina]EGV00578.1 hypothetical protein MCSF7_02699 [Mycoplasmopsis columbina SF7]
MNLKFNKHKFLLFNLFFIVFSLIYSIVVSINNDRETPFLLALIIILIFELLIFLIIVFLKDKYKKEIISYFILISWSLILLIADIVYITYVDMIGISEHGWVIGVFIIIQPIVAIFGSIHFVVIKKIQNHDEMKQIASKN